MRHFDLKDKVAIITGGNGGIGLGMACGFVECGASVVVAGRNSTKNAAAVAELTRIGGTASAMVVDVTDEAQCQAMVTETVTRYGRLNILVNNAGIGNPKSPHETTIAEWHTVMDANLTSALRSPCWVTISSFRTSPRSPEP
jgi:2-deoxy-D-gluconate 3-dehydrogenase